MVITFLTDFGLQDDFVGTCHGVIKRIAPEAEVIDITHGIPPQRVLQGALVLRNTLQYMPVGIHLAVIDPGVGGSRRPLALRDAEGRLYVGPDNGLLLPAAERFGGVVEAHELANPDYALQPVSRTFHGRDLFAPAAAHLANGAGLGDLGPPIAAETLARLDIPQPAIGEGHAEAVALYIDRYGNVQLNLDREGRGSSSSARESATTRSRRGRSRTRGRATSCSTRTRTGTSRSRSTAGMRPRCWPPAPATGSR